MYGTLSSDTGGFSLSEILCFLIFCKNDKLSTLKKWKPEGVDLVEEKNHESNTSKSHPVSWLASLEKAEPRR